jgi:hypothetical protein
MIICRLQAPKNQTRNRNNHQKPTFHPLGDFLNPALALLGQGLKKSPIGQKLDFANWFDIANIYFNICRIRQT